MSELALDLRGVAKTYRGRVRALRGVDLSVRRGEVFGLLGPNGAGKSTLVKILLTVIRPSACAGTVLGRPVGHKPTLARVGYLPEHHRFPGYMTGRQVVEFVGAMSGVPRAQRRRKAEELLDAVGMKEWAEKKVGGYSKGMRQRIGIAQALVNDPDLVLLDEPTDGVDPVGRRDIRDLVQRFKEQGRTVMLNSHLLSELEMVCDRVAIMVQGTVRSQGTLDELTAGQRRYEIRVADSGPSAAGVFARAAEGVGVACRAEGATLTVATTDAEVVQPILDRLRAGGATIVSVVPRRPSLEDLFLQAVTDPQTGQTLGPGAAKEGGR
jgi:ABC-2 type transport system ATP-binding protein